MVITVLCDKVCGAPTTMVLDMDCAAQLPVPPVVVTVKVYEPGVVGVPDIENTDPAVEVVIPVGIVPEDTVAPVAPPPNV